MVALVISIGGVIVFALMVGIISDTIGEKVDDLKKGKSRVIEVNHTLLLGWNDKIFSIIKEIASANDSIGGGCVVVLSDKDKEEMEREIEEANIDLKGSIIICRQGSPMNSSDLKKVAAAYARSIIVLSQSSRVFMLVYLYILVYIM